jgi:gliding motility-associated-like protein
MIQSLPGGVCNSLQDLSLNAFISAGAPGTWQTLSTPPGSNPATLIGSVLHIQGADPGTYRMRFTFDSAPIVACPDSAEINILIQDEPTINLPADISICDPVMISLSAIIGGSATNAHWMSSGSGSFNVSNGLNVTYMPTALDVVTGQVQIIAQTIDTLGFCSSGEDTMLLNLVSSPFTIWSAMKDTVCNDQINGSVSNLSSFIVGGDASGLWTDLDGSNVNLSDPSNVDFDGVSPGIYHFAYLTQSAVLPCTEASYSFEILVKDCTCPPLDIIHTDIISCKGDQLDLAALLIIDVAPGAWTLSGGPAGNWPVIIGNNVNTSNAIAGNYILTYTLTDSVPGCPASDGVNLLLDDAPSLSIASVICDELMITYNVTINTNAVTVNADFGTVTNIGNGQFNIINIQVDLDIQIEAASLQSCFSYLNVAAPNCACTLMIENLSDTIYLCRGDTIKLIPLVTGATGFPFNYWIDGSITVQKPSFPIYKDGTFIWLVKDSLCEKRDTFNVKLYDSVVLDADFLPPFCPGGNDGRIVINSIMQGAPPYSLQLDNQLPSLVQVFPDTIKQISTGLHQLTITDLMGCETLFSITIPDPTDRVLELGPDRVIALGDSALISPELINISLANYSWNPDSFSLDILPKWISPSETVLLKLTVTDSSGCEFNDEVLIKVNVTQKFFIPTIFSPNGDQINDVFQIETSSNPIDIQSLDIYDRWGNQVYSQRGSFPFIWNGLYKNKPAMNGVYVVKIIWKDEDGHDQYYISDLTLIR